MRHHALRKQAGKGLGDIDLADALERPRPEPRIQQVENGVLDTADILPHRQPAGDFRRVERRIHRLAGKAQEIPGGIDECVERVGLAPRRMAALRAIDMLPRRVALQRIARNGEVHVLGQGDGQLLLGHRHHTADLAMDEGDRRAPIALAGNPPVAQAPHGLAFAPAFAFRAGDERRLGLAHSHAGDEAGINQHPVARLGLASEGLVGIIGAGGHHAGDRQIVFRSEFEVALIVTRHRHDRPGAIVHQHEIGDPHRQGRAGDQRVGDGQAGIETQLLGGFQLGGGGAALLAQRDEGFGLG